MADQSNSASIVLLPERLQQMKKLTERGKAGGRYDQNSPLAKTTANPHTNTAKTVTKGGTATNRSSRADSANHEEVLKEIEELNEEMLISTYDDQQQHINAEQSVEEESIEKFSTAEDSQAHRRFEYQEPTIELRDKITRALKRPTALINFFHPEEKKESMESLIHETRRGYIYDCELEKQNYALKMRIMKVQEALLSTTVGSNFIELMNHPLESVDFRCYLEVLP